ncbi:MAG TPA: hypothetical protein VEW42_02695 [Candidatus Eisenbacteria bacterium]|nr:hypothetical protein [Candidatus Eisenbacteria bacterium]
MDPKQNSNPPLDPKLQQAYDKVMGVNLSDPAVPTTTPPTDPMATPVMPSTTPPVDPMATSAGQSVPLEAPAGSPLGGASMPATPAVDPMATPSMTPPAADPMAAMSPAGPTTVNITMPTPPASPSLGGPVSAEPSTIVGATPPAAMPSIPTPDVGQAPAANVPPAAPDSMNATITMPAHHDTQTVKIGIGGSPVASHAKVKGKGISPVILIFGAIAFLAVYGVFWIKFFGYNLPFLPQ